MVSNPHAQSFQEDGRASFGALVTPSARSQSLFPTGDHEPFESIVSPHWSEAMLAPQGIAANVSLPQARFNRDGANSIIEENPPSIPPYQLRFQCFVAFYVPFGQAWPRLVSSRRATRPAFADASGLGGHSIETFPQRNGHDLHNQAGQAAVQTIRRRRRLVYRA